MSLLLYLQRSNKVVSAYRRTLTNHVNNNVSIFNDLKRMYCCKTEPILTSECDQVIDSIFTCDPPPSEVNAIVNKEDKFGTLRKSLESKRKKIAGFNRLSETACENSVRNHAKPPSKEEKIANTFGNLDSTDMWYPDLSEENKETNDPNDDSTILLPADGKLKTAKTYLTEMKLLVKEKKLKQALELFLEMKHNYVYPIHANYTFMIGACGRAGYTEMAFKLLRQMTDKGFQPTPATLTGAFNACSECPFPEYGLKKAQLLKDKIEKKNWIVTQPTYHSMIKAFGRCGDIQTAFQIVDEMANADIKIDEQTYSFLLMSCAADKEAGFTHAMEVWRKMKAKKINPNIFTYNLLLRTVRDCGIGPEEISCLLLQHWSSYSKRPYGLGISQLSSKKDYLKLTNSLDNVDDVTQNVYEDHKQGAPSGNLDEAMPSEENVDSSNPKNNVKKFVQDEKSVMKTIQVPSLLAERPSTGLESVNLENVLRSCDRLALLGGVRVFLEHMKKNKARPTIKTFTLLLECIPYNTTSEEELLVLLDEYGVKPDIDFFNILIKKRNIRKDTTAGRNTLQLINKYGLSADIVTFGVLAMGCLNWKLASFLLTDMDKLDICPNIEIIGALIHNSTNAVDFKYIRDVLKLMLDKNITPNEKVLLMLEETVKSTRRSIIDMEQGKDVDSVYKREGFKDNYKRFCTYYEVWLKNIGVEIPQHLWLQYKTEITDKIKDSDLDDVTNV